MSKQRLAEYLTVDGAAEELRRLAAGCGATEFVRVRNLDYIVAPGELYPLAPRAPMPLPHIAAITVDMDGTSTTTEPLALHSLEYMVRRFTGRLTADAWSGLDPVLDYPYVIGNSNFRHTEFLVERYRDAVDLAALRTAFFEALVWTRATMDDPQRRRDIMLTARQCNLAGLLDDPEFTQATRRQDDVDAAATAPRLLDKHGEQFNCRHPQVLVAAALDVYYYRYHSILRAIEAGKGETLSRELLGASGRRLIEPMPGYAVFLALIKGHLGAEADALYEPLRTHLLEHGGGAYTAAQVDAWRPRLRQLGEYFARVPVKVALVTASIAYETHTSMREVIRIVRQEASGWPVSKACREKIEVGMSDYLAVFDAFICAADACEHRLKPHRDLYSLALYQMAVPRAEYVHCIGLEDTEPGIIALRAAGIGAAVALPNHDTTRQDYHAATHTLPGGLPELILAHNCLLAES